MTDPILLRRRVRVVLSALPQNRRASEELLFDKLEADFPDLKVDDLRKAIAWNHAKGFIEYHYSSDLERNEWFLTAEGRQKEGVA
jgi:uncharacterized protein (DUF433 family)